MIYKINDKYYVKVQGYYKEVSINKSAKGLEIKPVQNSKIEVSTVKKYDIVDLKKLEKAESKPDYSR